MNYLYHPDSPPSGVTLNQNGTLREVLLFPGKVVDLPADNGYTRVLLAEGHLLPLPPVALSPAPATTPAGKAGKGVKNEQPES